jgi:chromosomal replication initiation ATPase DnaA
MSKETVSKISPYVFPGIRKKDLPREKYPFLFNKEDEPEMIFGLADLEILRIVSETCGVTADQVISRMRDRNVVDARKIFSAVMKKKKKYALERIGKIIGNRDHTTIRHEVIEYDSLYKLEDAFKHKADSVMSVLEIKL